MSDYWNNLDSKLRRKSMTSYDAVNEASRLLSSQEKSRKSFSVQNKAMEAQKSNKLSQPEKAVFLHEAEKKTDELAETFSMLDPDDEELNRQVLRVALDISSHGLPPGSSPKAIIAHEKKRRNSTINNEPSSLSHFYKAPTPEEKTVVSRIFSMLVIALLVFVIVFLVLTVGTMFVGPPSQPVGSYQIFQVQEGDAFWDYYDFYEGPDSAGSNGYVNYVSKKKAFELGIANVTLESVMDDFIIFDEESNGENSEKPLTDDAGVTLKEDETIQTIEKEQQFIYMSSSPTEEGPRNSVRLEGKTRFNRGLFIIDLSHMPSGCGTWPAFWLTDESNWPINGEIDILEGVNYQTRAKTALHATQTCTMDDIPSGVRTGTWDTAVGIPDKKTGIPDMTLREANDCFVYNPHQWLNQGCVAVDDKDGTIGEPLNANGGGVYALEWDPINKHIRSWVFSSHSAVPENLKLAISSAGNPLSSTQVSPDPDLWGLPFGYFAIGEGTNCPSSHFKNMRLVINLSLCGSVAGNRFFLDCKEECKQFNSCNSYIKSNPEALSEAYWKIRGVYVYERTWERQWV